MAITGVISAILIGIVVGVLGRLVVPGRQPIGMLVTILVGIVSAFIGTAIARALGIPTATNGIDVSLADFKWSPERMPRPPE